jgi:hypothetical protein
LFKKIASFGYLTPLYTLHLVLYGSTQFQGGNAVNIFVAMFRYLIFIVLIFTAGQSAAQVRSKKKSEQPSSQQPSSLEPYKPQANYESKKSKSSGRITYDARDKFYARMEDVAKAYRKAEKEMQKPQYSDPSYFGHKKPPKRNKPGKMKYCKECGIRH